MKVFIITHCRDINLLYGSTLLFGSLRTGFPTADVTVVDNGSVPAARGVLELHARSVGAAWDVAQPLMSHHSLLAWLISQTPGEVVFVDPDIVFWQEVESWNFDALFAGRLIPEMDEPFSGCLTAARLHTSFLWIPDTARLLEAVGEVQRRYINFDPLTPYVFREGDVWRRFDTAGSLYAAFNDRARAFTAAELDAYDHLFCGSHLPLVLPRLPEDIGQQWWATHQAAAHGDGGALRGIHRQQQAYFASLAVREQNTTAMLGGGC